ncbi:MAG: hypothetical protein WB870_12825 [Gallionellaceae bacterium]
MTGTAIERMLRHAVLEIYRFRSRFDLALGMQLHWLPLSVISLIKGRIQRDDLNSWRRIND